MVILQKKQRVTKKIVGDIAVVDNNQVEQRDHDSLNVVTEYNEDIGNNKKVIGKWQGNSEAEAVVVELLWVTFYFYYFFYFFLCKVGR